ncbi:hypothetical protein ACIQMR_35390 [Streptomyces sp. NPDC091376]|uniref:hypothetical protein n=1 Tax=Streptomyces sp. NPDC091376 TaxID=3365994 RepID=UPI0037FBC944
MSYIDVYTYDGDPEEYGRDEPETVGKREAGHRSFTDGEELDAVSYITGLLSRGVHFDVRHTIF